MEVKSYLVGKMLEDIVKDEITGHLENISWIRQSQHELTKGKESVWQIR